MAAHRADPQRTVRVAAGGGPGAVAMSAVARAVGAPSGSVHHRFAGRPALLAREAALLLHGPAEFGRADWSEEHRERADRGNARVLGAVGSLAAVLGANGPEDQERVALALVDLPLAVVRRHLRSGRALPPYAEDLAEESAATLLAALAPDGT
ncbi:hypothetical protein ACWGHA_13150 [Streptomyces xanthophaeus]